jgi:hypothetical protein
MASGYYPTTCDDVVPAHNCDPCLPKEFGRIRAVAFIKDSFNFTNPEDSSEWQAGISSGDIVLIPQVHGSLADPTEKEGVGYGDTVSTVLGFDFAVTFFDPNYAENCDYYNALKKTQNWKFMYKTSTKGHLTNVTVTVIPKAPIADELTSEVVWVVMVKWADENHACPFDFPTDQLNCYITEGA